jgi:CRP/FNR family transcriptional regulator, cyclic AMP receptor protein
VDRSEVISQYSQYFEGIGDERARPRGTILIREGESANTLFWLKKGRVEVYSVNENGKEIIYDEISAEDIFGEMGVGNQPRSASVRATTEVVYAEIRYSDLFDRIASNPQLAIEMFFLAVRRGRQATGRVKTLALSDCYGGLRQLLYDHAGKGANDELIIDVGFSQADIARKIGCTRHMVNKLISPLVDGGYLTYTRERITIHRKLPEKF